VPAEIDKPSSPLDEGEGQTITGNYVSGAYACSGGGKTLLVVQVNVNLTGNTPKKETVTGREGKGTGKERGGHTSTEGEEKLRAAVWR